MTMFAADDFCRIGSLMTFATPAADRAVNVPTPPMSYVHETRLWSSAVVCGGDGRSTTPLTVHPAGRTSVLRNSSIKWLLVRPELSVQPALELTENAPVRRT